MSLFGFSRPQSPGGRERTACETSASSREQRASHTVWTRAGLVGLGLGMLGCSLDSNFGELGEKLLDPEIRGFDTPGQQILAGPHFESSIQADEAGARYALARNAAGELAIASFERETFCRAGRVERYGVAFAASRLPALIPVLTSEPDGTTRLTFSDFACARSSFSVETSNLPEQVVSGLPTGSGSALLVRTDDRGLLLVDPWARQTRRVAESIRNADPIGISAAGRTQYAWVDRGELVISDATLTPVARYGSAITELIAASAEGEIAYVEARAGAGPSGSLHLLDTPSWAEPAEPRQVADDVCSVRFLTWQGRRKLAYLAPCSERRLVLHDLVDETVRVISANVSGGPSARTVRGESILTFVTTDSPNASSGTLWLVRGDADPIAIAENARVNPSAVTPDGGLLAVRDWTNSGGRLVAWKDDVLTEVADGVIELNTLGVLEDGALTLLGHFDGVTGDLMRLNPDLTTEVLAQGVPQRGAEEDAFLANFDGETGELRYLDRASGSSEVLGTGVGRGGFLAARQFAAVMMLSERSPEDGTSTLLIRLLESKREYALHTGVTEAREVALPSPGVLYNVAVGEDAGLWFSKAL